MSKESKVEKFINKNLPKQSPSTLSQDTIKVKSTVPEPKIETKDIVKLTPERFKKVQERLKAGSSIKSKLSKAIKANDADAADTIVKQVGEVAKKTGNTDLLKDLIKKVRKAGLTRKAGKKLLSAVPFVGGALSALSSGDIKAAVPGLDAIDDLGPKKGSLDSRIESGRLTPEDIKLLKKQNRL